MRWKGTTITSRLEGIRKGLSTSSPTDPKISTLDGDVDGDAQSRENENGF